MRIKENRPKGKIALKNKDQTEETVRQGNRKQRRQESNQVYLQTTPSSLLHTDTHDLKN